MVIHNASFVSLGIGRCLYYPLNDKSISCFKSQSHSSCSERQSDYGVVVLVPISKSLPLPLGSATPDHKPHLDGDKSIFSVSHYSLLTTKSPSISPLTIVNNCIIGHSAEANT